MILVVGATGLLGSDTCRRLVRAGKPVRALVRETSSPDKVASLRGLGAEIAVGDLKDRRSLDAACKGVDAVVSTASSTISRQSGDSIESVDRQGQLDLVEAAEASGVGRFVLVSFPEIPIDFPLQTAKRAVEARLGRSRMKYTILQPTCFAEIWLGPALGFDVASGSAQVFGTGRNRMSWISFQDVAKFTVAALESPLAANAAIRLGGPEALSALDVVRLAEHLAGRKFAVQHVPEEALRAQHRDATDAFQKTFAALMLYTAGGDAIEMSATLRDLPVGPLRTVREHLEASLTPP